LQKRERIYVGIGGNERADRAPKDALEKVVATGLKVGKLEYCRWVKEEFKRMRLCMGYTNLTQGYRIIDEIKPLCPDCNQDITVEHIVWQCPNYDIQCSRSNISREALGNNKEAAKMVIKYLKEIELVHYI
jgi:hypothetical protein